MRNLNFSSICLAITFASLATGWIALRSWTSYLNSQHAQPAFLLVTRCEFRSSSSNRQWGRVYGSINEEGYSVTSFSAMEFKTYAAHFDANYDEVIGSHNCQKGKKIPIWVYKDESIHQRSLANQNTSPLLADLYRATGWKYSIFSLVLAFSGFALFFLRRKVQIISLFLFVTPWFPVSHISAQAFKSYKISGGDTLFVVKPGGISIGRDIRLELEYSGSDDGFWTYGDDPIRLSNNEPLFSIDSPNYSKLSPVNGNVVTVAKFNNNAYPSTLPPYSKNVFKASASAFGESEIVYVTFLSEERTEQSLNIPILDDFINNKMKEGLKKISDPINSLFGTNITIEGAGLTGTRTAFNKEEPGGPDYWNHIEKTLTVGLGINTGNLFVTVPPYSGNLPFGAGKYGLFLNFGIGLEGVGEIVSNKYYWQEEYELSSFALEAGIVGSPAMGIKLELSPALEDIVQVNLGANFLIPVEAKIKNEFRFNDGWYLVGELSWGPIYLVIPLEITLLPNSGFDWELINMTFQWSLTNKLEVSHEKLIYGFED